MPASPPDADGDRGAAGRDSRAPVPAQVRNLQPPACNGRSFAEDREARPMVMRLVRENGVRGDWHVKSAGPASRRGRITADGPGLPTDDGMPSVPSDARNEPDDQPSP